MNRNCAGGKPPIDANHKWDLRSTKTVLLNRCIRVHWRPFAGCSEQLPWIKS